MKFLKYIAMVGSALFILWVTYNGINEDFSGTIVQKISYIGLVTILLLNIFLLYRKK